MTTLDRGEPTMVLVASVYGTKEQRQVVQQRAAMHGKSCSAYLVSAALSDVASQMSAADHWWNQLAPSEKDSYYRWLGEKKKRARGQVPEELLVALPFDETG